MSSDTEKKIKTLAKAKKVAEKPAVAAKTAVKVPAKKKAIAPKAKKVASVTPTHAEIARLAEQYWIERGWQDGYAEQDWLRAEQELLGIAS